TESRVQGCAVYREQSSGVRCVQRAEFRGALCTECRVQGCAMYGVQSSVVRYVLYRLQSSGVLYVPGCTLYRVMSSGVHYIQRDEFSCAA
ncbi:unnamed protein product, partial [Staurois parvus]